MCNFSLIRWDSIIAFNVLSTHFGSGQHLSEALYCQCTFYTWTFEQEASSGPFPLEHNVGAEKVCYLPTPILRYKGFSQYLGDALFNSGLPRSKRFPQPFDLVGWLEL